jgi:glyoxylase-like metal-dependent hydrolase (beta-lactamase superfamily II)
MVTRAVDTASPDPLPAYRFRLGHLELCVLDDGFFVVDGAFLAANCPPRSLAAACAQGGLDPTAHRLPIHPLLIECGSQRLLVDTGNGVCYRAFRPDAGKLLAALQTEGIAPEEIDLVLLTHLHPDHIGGAVDEFGTPIFPHARYLIGRTEYAFWWAEPSLDELPFPVERRQFLRQAAKDTLVALQGKIEQLDPGEEIAPGITVVAAPGHTPGHLAVELVSGEERALHVVDAAAEPSLNLGHPDWFLLPDLWPVQALQTRRALLDRAASEQMLVLTTHFPFPGVGRVRGDNDGWQWTAVA